MVAFIRNDILRYGNQEHEIILEGKAWPNDAKRAYSGITESTIVTDWC